MPCITFGFTARFQHRGILKEVTEWFCPANKSHKIAAGEFCPDCGTKLTTKTKKQKEDDWNEIRSLINSVWKVAPSHITTMFTYAVDSARDWSDVILVPRIESDGYIESDSTGDIVVGFDPRDYQDKAIEVFGWISSQIQREHSGVKIGIITS